MSEAEGLSLPVILHHSLADSEIHRILKNKQFKIRVSSSTPVNTCVFPLSLATFTVEPITSTQNLSPLIQRFDKLLELYYNQYVFLLSPMIGNEQIKLLIDIQKRYLIDDIKFLLVHNYSECIQGMMPIVKVTCSPVCDTVKMRYRKVMEGVVNEGTVMMALHEAGLTSHDANVLYDGCGSLESIAKCNQKSIVELTSLENTTANNMIQFIHSSTNN